ncbi:hypothetical protein [Streptomyces chartreusis]
MPEGKPRERALAESAEILRQITREPETVAAFDAEYGAPTLAQSGPQST